MATALSYANRTYLAVGDRVAVRMWHQRKDQREMRRWPAHVLPPHWLDAGSANDRRCSYAVDLLDCGLIGRITLRDFSVDSVLGHSARIGMYLHPGYYAQGIGTEALNLFLQYDASLPHEALTHMKLDVALDNQRAIKVYRKAGFRICGMFIRNGHAYLEMERR